MLDARGPGAKRNEGKAVASRDRRYCGQWRKGDQMGVRWADKADETFWGAGNARGDDMRGGLEVWVFGRLTSCDGCDGMSFGFCQLLTAVDGRRDTGGADELR